MNGKVIHLPAYWEKTNPGFKKSFASALYAAWLTEHVGMRAVDWDFDCVTYRSGYDTIPFIIAHEHEAEKIKRELEDMITMHVLKNGAVVKW